jgi:hypothetical protein
VVAVELPVVLVGLARDGLRRRLGSRLAHEALLLLLLGVPLQGREENGGVGGAGLDG